jgi:hypothetical protein
MSRLLQRSQAWRRLRGTAIASHSGYPRGVWSASAASLVRWRINRSRDGIGGLRALNLADTPDV